MIDMATNEEPACICEPPYPTHPLNWPEDKLAHQSNCPQDYAAGTLCRKHFEQRWVREFEVAACTDCQAARRAEAERIQRECTIDPNQPYGQHIMLRCRKHPNLRWHTKNIDFIGARTIFFAGDADECGCSVSDLVVVPIGDEQQ